MALGLKDLQNTQKINKKANEVEKERVIRPWEGFEQLEDRTRTIAAQEAVKKARQIVARNLERSREFSERWEHKIREKEFKDFVTRMEERDREDEKSKYSLDEELEKLAIHKKQLGIRGLVRGLLGI